MSAAGTRPRGLYLNELLKSVLHHFADSSIRPISLRIMLVLMVVCTGCGVERTTSVPERGDGSVTQNSGDTAMPAQSDWPRMSGPLFNHSTVVDSVEWSFPASGPSKVWSVTCGSGYGMPIVSGRKVFVLAREDGHSQLRALDVNDGSQIWTWTGPEATYSDDYDQYSDGPYSTPCVEDGTLYAITGEGVLFAIDPETGDELRSLDLLSTFGASVGPFPWGTSPCAFDAGEGRRLLINVGGNDGRGVVCLDATTFEPIWTTTEEGRCYATPRVAEIAGQQIGVVFTDRNVVGLNLADGAELWREPFGVKGDPKLRANSVSPLVVGNVVYVTAGPGAGTLRIEMKPGGEVDSKNLGRRTIDSQFNNLVASGDFLYGYCSKWNGQAPFRCLERHSGETAWSFDSDLQRGSSVLVNDRLLLLGEEGHLVLLKANPLEPEVVCQSEGPVITGPCYTAPTVVGDRMFVRTEREVACFQLSTGSP